MRPIAEKITFNLRGIWKLRKRCRNNYPKRFLSLTGFTLVELIVSMLIVSILMLIVGVIGNTGVSSYEKLRKEAEVYNDLYFGVDLIERSVRRATNVAVAGNTLKTDTTIFMNLSYTDPSGNRRYKLVYIDVAGEHIIVQNLTSLGFIPVHPSVNLYTAMINGTKDNVNFNLTLNVTRRNG